MKRSALVGAFLATAVLTAAPEARGQDLRTFTAARQHRGEDQLDLNVRFGMGTLRLEGGASGILYRMRLRYDADRFEPVAEFDDRTRRATLGTRSVDRRGRVGVHDPPEQTLAVQITPDVPVALELAFGAGRAQAELGGLRLTRVAVETGAAETAIRWSAPNEITCTELAIKMGAAGFAAEGLGSARCRRITLAGAAGEAVLDFSGAWTADATVEVKVGLAALELRFPTDVGVRIEATRFLASLEQPGFAKRDGVYYSANWESATVRIRVTTHAALGEVRVAWVEPDR